MSYENLNRVICLMIIILAVINRVSCDETHRKLRRQKRIVGGVEAAQPPEDDPVVFVSKNERDARIYGNRDEHKGFYVFRGIRFGEPPLGRHRFQRPRAVHPEGDINATNWGPPCPQPDVSKAGNVIGSEDCLFLNIFTPALPDGGDGYPVLIWIHGGGFRRGAACQYEMRNLIKKKMIVVSIQYRLGSLGFLSTGTKDLPGNNGMFDMTLALNWVKDYIEFFGGNPKKIIAFGHGTGASSALMLSLSKLTQNFFSGLIAMSGSILSHFAIDRDPMSSAKAVAAANDCPTKNIPEMIRCLQELPVDNLIGADSVLESIRMSVQGFVGGLAGVLGPSPVIDGQDDQRSLPNFLTQEPNAALKLGDFPKIPLLTGVIRDETAGAISGGYRAEVQRKLESIPNFLNDDLIKKLQSTVQPTFGNGGGNGSWQFVPEAFSEYLKILGGQSGHVGEESENVFRKVADVTKDALFNAPAFLTSKEWSKKAKTFLYSFDHNSGRNFGSHFLAGLPIVDAKKKTEIGVSSHGDELGYIFGRNSILGESLTAAVSEAVIDPEADRVTDVFTEMIASFARDGEVFITPEMKSADKSFLKIPSFGGSGDVTKANPFVSVTSQLKLMENFRFCEMGLWAGLVERLQSTTCGLFKSSIETIRNTGEQTFLAAEKIGQETFGAVKDAVDPGKIFQPAAVVGNVIRGFIPGSKPGREKDNAPGNSATVYPKTESNFGGLIPRIPGGFIG